VTDDLGPRSARGQETDTLTGLATVGALQDRLRELEPEARSGRAVFGVVLFDVRDMSTFNRLHGFPVGQALIHEVAHRLEILTRRPPAGSGSAAGSSSTDTGGSAPVADPGEVVLIARTGGAQFAVLVRQGDAPLSQFRRWLRAALHKQPWILDGALYEAHVASSFRSWDPNGGRDLLWWVQDDHRVLARRDLEKRIAALEDLLSQASGVDLTGGLGLWARLQQAEEVARRDPNGSGALNRYGASEVLATLRAPYSLAFVDVDHLREINARVGNWESGDEALAGVVRVLSGCSDGVTVTRWGGDEFLVLLPGLDAAAAADALTSALARCRDEVRVGDLPVTFSAGVAQVSAGAGPDAHNRAEATARARARALKDGDNRGQVRSHISEASRPRTADRSHDR
jgi:diguanylate cyclase (GGDEF)-like protein